METAMERRPASLSRTAARVAVCYGGARRVSGGDRRPGPCVALEEVDERYLAQEDRLSRADHHRRSRHGRSVGSHADRRRGGRNAACRADMFLVCQKEESVWRAFEAVYKKAESDKKCARLVSERSKRVLAAKKRSRPLKARMAPAPTQTTVDKLRRDIWEFSEEVRAYALAANEVLV